MFLNVNCGVEVVFEPLEFLKSKPRSVSEALKRESGQLKTSGLAPVCSMAVNEERKKIVALQGICKIGVVFQEEKSDIRSKIFYQ
jgi:hypothetical protein